VGQADFSKKQPHVYSRKLMQESISSLFTQEFSLVVGLHVRPEDNFPTPPKELVSADIFGSLG